ncbi:MAG: OmpW family outer membrane protein [Desulfatibacillaceae bacterium]|nr:OmpW family outer membrane protein [Desulfatibacillaceae bacterium]
MKKICLLALVAVLAIGMVAGPAFGADRDNRFALGGRISYVLLTSYTDKTNANFETEFGGAALFEIDGTWFVNNMFSLEMGLGYDKVSVDGKNKTTGAKASIGDITQIPLTLTGRLHYPGESFAPYIGFGCGYYFNSLDLDAVFQATMPAGTSQDIDNSFGWHLGAGIEYFFDDNWALNVDYKYVWNESDVETTTAAGTIKDKVEMNGSVIGLGFKYLF